MNLLKRMTALLLLLSGFVLTAQASYYDSTDYMAIMIDSAITGDIAAGKEAAASRDEKIEALGLEEDHISIDFTDLYLLAKIMYAEAGSSWLSDEWKMSVGEVVLNRVASPKFPDTVPDVLYQPGQYYGANSSYFESILPDERCVLLALRLLEGERVLNNENVLYQSNVRLGSGVHTVYYDSTLGNTYFCYG